jgi:hypothetical protein
MTQAIVYAVATFVITFFAFLAGVSIFVLGKDVLAWWKARRRPVDPEIAKLNEISKRVYDGKLPYIAPREDGVVTLDSARVSRELREALKRRQKR